MKKGENDELVGEPKHNRNKIHKHEGVVVGWWGQKLSGDALPDDRGRSIDDG